MAKSNAVTIAEIQLTLHEMEKDITEIKECLKTDYQTKESATAVREANIKLTIDLENRVTKIEASLSKITWAIIMAVLGAVLSLVIKGV